MSAYYNEIDPFAAQWLRELIADGHIAPGVVDTRSIVDVRPDELRGYTQCHFFAGIGVWSYALRLAGWPDDRPVWTGSCPCQPFSAAGKGSGFDDERHLWPFWHYLIEQCRPSDILGEQVASKDGLAWFDLVQADLEGSRYAAGALDTCSAGSGAPHIRQRLRFAAKSLDDPSSARHIWTFEGAEGLARHDARVRLPSFRRALDELDHHHHQGLEGLGRGHRSPLGHGKEPLRPTPEASEFDLLDIATGGRLEGVGYQSTYGKSLQAGANARALADDDDDGRSASTRSKLHDAEYHAQSCGHVGRWPGPTNGHWGDADWLFCRDGKWRPVEPSTFPLAHGAPARVGRLRGYGNAVDAEATRVFIEAYLEVEAAGFVPLRKIDSEVVEVSPFADLLGGS